MLLLCYVCPSYIFFFKQKTVYEWRISDWSSDVCSSDLEAERAIEVVLVGGLDPHHAVGVAPHGHRRLERGDADLTLGFRQRAAHPEIAAADENGGDDQQPADDNEEDASNRSYHPCLIPPLCRCAPVAFWQGQGRAACRTNP